MHERHIERASAIVSATDLLPDLAAVVNDYLIPITDEDKVAALIADQRDSVLRIRQQQYCRDITINWVDLREDGDPRHFDYALTIGCAPVYGAPIVSRLFTMQALCTITPADPTNGIVLMARMGAIRMRQKWSISENTHEFIVQSVARLAADY